MIDTIITNFEYFNNFFFYRSWVSSLGAGLLSFCWTMFYIHDEHSPFLKRQFLSLMKSIKIIGLIYIALYSYLVLFNSIVDYLLTYDKLLIGLFIDNLKTFSGLEFLLIFAFVINLAYFISKKLKIDQNIASILLGTTLSVISFLILFEGLVHLFIKSNLGFDNNSMILFLKVILHFLVLTTVLASIKTSADEDESLINKPADSKPQQA